MSKTQAGRGRKTAPQGEARIEARLVEALARQVAAARLLLHEDSRCADNGKAVHQARRHLKVVRSIIRLLKPAAPQAADALMRLAREAMHHLSARRDAQVFCDTADKLARQIDTSSSRHLLKRLADERSCALTLAEDIDKARQAVNRLGDRIAHIKPGDGDAVAFADSAAKLYRKAREGWRAAQAAGDVEALHEWRKRIRDRLHIAGLFAECWPEPSPPRRRTLERLSDVLGKERDLALLDAALPARSKTAASIRLLVARRRARLTGKALKLAGSVFAQKPAKVRDHWRRHAEELRPASISAKDQPPATSEIPPNFRL